MTRTVSFIISAFIFFSHPVSAESTEPSGIFVKYQIKEGDTLSNIFRRLKLYPIWSKNGAIEKTIELNSYNPELLKDRHNLEVGQVIHLPIKKGDVRFQYNNSGLLLLGSYASEEYPRKLKSKKRQLASSSFRKIKNLNFEFGCQQSTNSAVFKNLGNMVNQVDSKIENVSIHFNCKNATVLTKDSQNSDYGDSERQPAQFKDKTQYKLKPWMMSFAPQQNISQSSSQQKNDSSSFFFPSIGYNTVSYSEGAFENSFTNGFIALRYRQIISKPFWHVDSEIKFGALSLSNDYLDSTAQILDVDLRVGRAFQILNEPWHFTLFAGAFYTQMIVSDDLYGYKGTYYPQIYPELRRILSSGDSLNFFLKFIPTGKNFLEFGSDAALTLGAQYNMQLLNNDIFINFNHSNFSFKSKTNTQIEVNQTSLGLGAGF